MFSSNNTNNLISSYDSSTPFSFESNHTYCSKQYYENETTTITYPCPSPFSFFQFPYSPTFEDNNQFFLLQQQQQQHGSNLQSLPQITTPLQVVNNNNTDASASASASMHPPAAEQGKKIKEQKQQIPTSTRKRTSKRDRHSKIKTARGLRDRRMRLSLEVAKEFFGLQDMLGFEKASKTVEWLLNKSKAEIKELAKRKNLLLSSCAKSTTTASSTSDCEEGVSSLDEVVERDQQQQTHTVAVKAKKKRSRVINKVFRKSAFSPIGREKARERARERTREKILKKTKNAAAADHHQSNSKQCNNVVDAKNNNINSLLWNPFETVEEEPSSQAKEHSGTTGGDNSLFIMSKWSPTMMFSSRNNSGLILQEHQFAQFQSLEKPWEDYNNRI